MRHYSLYIRLKYLLSLLTLFLSISSLSQINYQGKASYILSTNKSYIVDFWFAKDRYQYQYRTDDPGNSRVLLDRIKNRPHTNISDSLRDIEIIKEISNDSKSVPPQLFYGELDNNYLIQTWIELNTRKKYCVKDTGEFVNWKLSEDTMRINGLLCQKAISKFKGKDYEAWFAPSIPVSVAPFQFRGLPGLLIECINKTQNFKLTIMDLEWPLKKEIVIEPCSDAPVITTAEKLTIMNTENAKGQQILQTIQNAQKDGKKVKIDDVINSKQ